MKHGHWALGYWHACKHGHWDGAGAGAPPKVSNAKAVGIQTNPTCALYRSALPLRNLSTSIAMPYAQQAHSYCHSVTSRPSFSLSQFHGHTAAARGCVSEQFHGRWAPGAALALKSVRYCCSLKQTDFGGISAIFELRERGSRILRWQVPPALRSSARTERAHHVSIV